MQPDSNKKVSGKAGPIQYLKLNDINLPEF
jgi:hypothetical protein